MIFKMDFIFILSEESECKRQRETCLQGLAHSQMLTVSRAGPVMCQEHRALPGLHVGRGAKDLEISSVAFPALTGRLIRSGVVGLNLYP